MFKELSKAQLNYCNSHRDILIKLIKIAKDKENVELTETLLDSEEIKEFFTKNENTKDELEALLIINKLAE